ncbi:uncharacterized protein E5676_scaffold236G00210 [Cucumis melo var. makuwa]|uniref:Uncharacterized protein n=1 Tax=Cucumis melo var. makuwa TaxID=1194695 RepID=A0A5A7U4N2_CUCMM|nr:uncharacterized protein E6C27_scaffold61G002260 [Cucumis melo var. makuwa]TYK27173.1 uncharacterized protein E5676_scaffold236G00210 [Cucumis melo var. makuwa]
MAHSASSSQATSIPGIVKPTDVPTAFTFSSSCNRSKSFQLPTMGSSRVHAQNRFSVESISDSFDDDNHAALSRLLRLPVSTFAIPISASNVAPADPTSEPSAIALATSLVHFCHQVNQEGCLLHMVPEDGYSFVLRSPEQLAVKLSGHSVHLWTSDGQLLVLSLSVKYAILHKIEVDVDDFVYKHVFCHVDIFRLPRGVSQTIPSDVRVPADGLMLSTKLTSRVVSLLVDE